MHLHILGIGGTFMGGLAVLARALGHRVSGADRNVFPPMSTQLESLGIPFHEGYDADALPPGADVVVVGNVLSRGSPVIERLLDAAMPYTSGPQWLAEHALAGRHVLAVAGTHGKTSTASMLAWILEHAGLQPGFLIGGVPVDFGVSARLGESEFFVVEADEYDTAFFDKRSKFVHYRPRTLILTNLEFDHADIFADLAAIRLQFHHLLRTVPARGVIVASNDAPELDQVLAMGCWTPVERYGSTGGMWQVNSADKNTITVSYRDERVSGPFFWPGRHNRENALAACAAAHHVGVPLETSLAALARWQGVRRRLERVGSVAGVDIFDDFAHHPTEIAATLEALRSACDEKSRLVAVFEPRSNSMKMGTHGDQLGAALSGADRVFLYRPADLAWDLGSVRKDAGCPVSISDDIDMLLAQIVADVHDGDQVVIMSNGAFAGLPGRLYAALHTGQ